MGWRDGQHRDHQPVWPGVLRVEPEDLHVIITDVLEDLVHLYFRVLEAKGVHIVKCKKTLVIRGEGGNTWPDNKIGYISPIYQKQSDEALKRDQEPINIYILREKNRHSLSQ